ncbi:uncharacterized protein LOC131665642 [Phymastichus coffea]|uniref:uncharacterized protein LOC131665642 n=1 Tax=Phymastichus coffea TaxID=108790 RepID=UPI00273B6E83|nr:uncharacterized protein LOC131665642 [Phymastichus coffea]
MKAFVFVAVAILACAHAQSIDECLQQDSISCVQKSLFRKAKEFFDSENLEIATGVSLVKSTADRNSRSGKNLVYEQEINQANDVAERQSALENFVGDEVGDFFSGRSLRINFSPVFTKISESARALSESIPVEIKEAANEVVEGRGKKKMLKKILPLLLLAKVKIGALAVLGYFAIALIAKKAIIASIISIAISAFLGLKSLWAKQSGHDTTGYSSGWNTASAGGWAAPVQSGGWSSVASTGGWDDASSYNAHSQAFSGYHRR